MFSGFRGRLFLVSLLLVLVIGSVSALFLETQLRGWFEERVESDLLARTRLISELVEHSELPPTIDSLDALADRLSPAGQTRVTIIRADGTVLGDSLIDRDRLAQFENHGDRPEIRKALAAGSGVARRYSTTLETDLLYAAIRYDTADGSGVVRSAVTLEAVDRTLARLRRILVVAGLIGLVLAVLMSGLASHLMSRTLRQIVDNATALAHGRGDRIRIESRGEIGRLAGSINQLSDELEGTMSKLASERARLREVLESMSEGVITVDSAQKIVTANGAARRFCGIEGEVLGQSLIGIVREPALGEALTAGESRRGASLEFELPGNPVRTMLTQVTPLAAGSGHVVVLHDVSEMRRLERVRRDFVANVSHELRTPVSVILGNAETLAEGALDDRDSAPRFLDGIRRNAERLSQLIADLLDLSRIEAGRYALETRRTEIRPILERAADAVCAPMSGKNQSIAISDEGAVASADPEALEQVLLNLLDNAVKYTPENGRISVASRSLKGSVRIEVSDNGPGIETRHHERIFERFYRVDPGRSRKMGGTGLGLSIVKNLVEAMGGSVGVESGSPTGSVFWVTLPT